MSSRIYSCDVDGEYYSCCFNFINPIFFLVPHVYTSFEPLPVKRTIPYNYGTFFITFTCKDWLPLIKICEAYELVYNWFALLKNQGHYINAYVIMPNHIHVLITFVDVETSINNIIGNGKRFMAYQIVNRLEQLNKSALLKRLQDSVEEGKKKRNKLHDIWEVSFHWKHCSNDSIKYQKLNYIHNNPCSGKWKLAVIAEKYVHSSAGFYATGKQGVFFVDNIESMKDIVLNPRTSLALLEDITGG
jgi:REP element-mobilizing transposase RayT